MRVRWLDWQNNASTETDWDDAWPSYNQTGKNWQKVFDLPVETTNGVIKAKTKCSGRARQHCALPSAAIGGRRKRRTVGEKSWHSPPPPSSPYTTLTRSAGVIYQRFCSPHQRDIMPDTAPITAAQTEQLCPFASQTTTTRRLCGFFIDRSTKWTIAASLAAF